MKRNKKKDQKLSSIYLQLLDDAWELYKITDTYPDAAPSDYKSATAAFLKTINSNANGIARFMSKVIKELSPTSSEPEELKKLRKLKARDHVSALPAIRSFPQVVVDIWKIASNYAATNQLEIDWTKTEPIQNAFNEIADIFHNFAKRTYEWLKTCLTSLDPKRESKARYLLCAQVLQEMQYMFFKNARVIGPYCPRGYFDPPPDTVDPWQGETIKYRYQMT